MIGNILFPLFLSLLMLQASLTSVVRECSSLQEVCSEVGPETIFLFDLDNTLMRPCQMLGSDEWFQYYFSSTRQQMKDQEAAMQRAIELLHAVYAVTCVKPIEQCTAEVISSLQKQGVPMIGVTSRSPSVASITIRQLASIGIDFTLTAPSKASFPLIGCYDSLFFKGILLTSGKSKKNSLTAFFQQISWKPKRIICVDDKATHLHEMQAFEDEGIRFLGLRYSGADECVRSLDPQICDIQLRSFLHIMSDTEASEHRVSPPGVLVTK